MAQKFTWEQIKKDFNGEWIQLVDYEWDRGEADPQAGVVRIHSTDKKEFHRLLKANPVSESAILYVGEMFHSDVNTIFNANQHQWFGAR